MSITIKRDQRVPDRNRLEKLAKLAMQAARGDRNAGLSPQDWAVIEQTTDSDNAIGIYHIVLLDPEQA